MMFANGLCLWWCFRSPRRRVSQLSLSCPYHTINRTQGGSLTPAVILVHSFAQLLTSGGGLGRSKQLHPGQACSLIETYTKSNVTPWPSSKPLMQLLGRLPFSSLLT